MKKITFITPDHRLYELRAHKSRTTFIAENYILSIRCGKHSLDLPMMTGRVRWEEHLEFAHTIVHLTGDPDEYQADMLRKLGDFRPVSEYAVVSVSPRAYRNADVYTLKKLKSEYEARKEEISQNDFAEDQARKKTGTAAENAV